MEIKDYVEKILTELEHVKKVRNGLYLFRCPICGDSAKNTFKRRGYLIKTESDNYRFFCHNCSTSLTFDKFLKQVDFNLYQQYTLDNIQKQKTYDFSTDKKETEEHNSLPKDNLVNLLQLPSNHQAIKYVQSRKLPLTSYKNLYYTPDVKTFIHTNIKEKYDNTVFPFTEGIVFILKDIETRNITGYQIRTINAYMKDKTKRFITCTYTENKGYFFSDTLNLDEPNYVIEGTFDSLFLPNSIAVLNSSLYTYHNENSVYFNDQEPFNKEVVKHIKTCIEKNYKTILLPKNMFLSMDVNDIVKKYKATSEDLVKLFNKYTYQGLSAKMAFAKWIN